MYWCVLCCWKEVGLCGVRWLQLSCDLMAAQRSSIQKKTPETLGTLARFQQFQ